MYKVNIRKTKLIRRKARVRGKVVGTAEKPRLNVFRSNRHMYAQLIDDLKGHTLVSAASLIKVGKTNKPGTKTDEAKETGVQLAKKALEKGIKQAVFDRNGYKYHGRIKNLADAAREGGLKI